MFAPVTVFWNLHLTSIWSVGTQSGQCCLVLIPVTLLVGVTLPSCTQQKSPSSLSTVWDHSHPSTQEDGPISWLLVAFWCLQGEALQLFLLPCVFLLLFLHSLPACAGLFLIQTPGWAALVDSQQQKHTQVFFWQSFLQLCEGKWLSGGLSLSSTGQVAGAKGWEQGESRGRTVLVRENCLFPSS